MGAHLLHITAVGAHARKNAADREIIRFLSDVCGKDPMGTQRERHWLRQLENGALDLNTTISAAYCIFDDVVYCSFSDKALETIIGHAGRGSTILHHILSCHSPESDRIRPFWLPDNGQVMVLPGGFGEQRAGAIPAASEASFEAIIHHPDTNLGATNIHGQSVLDLWAKLFVRQENMSSTKELKQGLTSYHRMCQLMKLSAPLLSLHQDALIAKALQPIAQDYLDDFLHTPANLSFVLQPNDIDHVIFRHWSICGMLNQALASEKWIGHEQHLLHLLFSLPENERPMTHPLIVEAIHQSQHNDGWVGQVSSTPARPNSTGR